MENLHPHRRSHWPHRLAVALALVTFPLIWVGGLVTTYDAGMAVPDWPGTYGYNLLAYPWTTWVAGPFDLFIEHGHRLLGAAAGLLAIALVIVVYRTDRRAWLRRAAWGALALVVFQGVLGGARVLLDERLAALVHGCVGPLFFAYLAGLVVATSRWWHDAQHEDSAAGKRLIHTTWMLAAAAYLQLFLGALVRHMPLSATPQLFRVALLLHLIVAAALVLQMAAACTRTWRVGRGVRGFRGLALALPLLLFVQIALGIGTYVAKYSYPAWLDGYQFAAAYVVQEKSLAQSLITTAHVAGGSLILFLATFLAMRATRVSIPGMQHSVPSPRNGGRRSESRDPKAILSAA